MFVAALVMYLIFYSYQLVLSAYLKRPQVRASSHTTSVESRGGRADTRAGKWGFTGQESVDHLRTPNEPARPPLPLSCLVSSGSAKNDVMARDEGAAYSYLQYSTVLQRTRDSTCTLPSITRRGVAVRKRMRPLHYFFPGHAVPGPYSFVVYFRP
jgi:hypothetical protein